MGKKMISVFFLDFFSFFSFLLYFFYHTPRSFGECVCVAAQMSNISMKYKINLKWISQVKRREIHRNSRYSTYDGVANKKSREQEEDVEKKDETTDIWLNSLKSTKIRLWFRMKPCKLTAKLKKKTRKFEHLICVYLSNTSRTLHYR